MVKIEIRRAMNWSKRLFDSRRIGFSLIELLVVMAILGLLASGSMLVLSGFVRRAESLTSRESIKNLVLWARIHSNSGPVTVVFDLDDQIVLVSATNSGISRRLRTKGQFRISGCISGNNFQQDGKISISFEQGLGQSFAICIKQQKNKSERVKWILFCGLTGEIYEIENESGMSGALRIWLSTSRQPD